MFVETINLWEGRDDVKLTTFIDKANPQFPDAVKRPAIIICPGGSYAVCMRHGGEGDMAAAAFAADGYQCFTLEYSVLTASAPENVLFPSQLYDLGKAILTIREHADEWLIDVDKISIMGFSAGGNLCGMYATSWSKNLLAEKFGEKPEVFKPLCAILVYPLLDYVLQNSWEDAASMEFLPDDSNSFIFGTPNPDTETEKKYSPLYQLDENCVPVFLTACMNDMMVNPIQTLDFAKKLQEMGIHYELHMFEYGGHAYGTGRNMFEPFREEKAFSAAKWVPLAKTFLMHQVSPETTAKEHGPFEH